MKLGQNSANPNTFTNVFMSIIHDKPKSGFFKKLKHKRAVKKFRNDIKEGSPGFGLLWRMADFIKLAEDCFFYANTLDNTEFGLYSSRAYTRGQNGFKLYDHEAIITIKLISETEKVIMEIDRIKSNSTPGVCSSKTTLSFSKEQWDNKPTMYDEMLLEAAIRKINSRILYLFDYCYDRW